MARSLNETKSLTQQNGKFWFYILLILIWGQHTIFNFIIEVIERLPIIKYFSTMIFPICVMFCIIFSLKYITKCLSIKDYLFYLFLLFLIFLTMIIYPQNSQYIEAVFPTLIGAIPLFFVGRCFDIEETKKLLFWLSFISICFAFLYQAYYIFTGRTLLSDNMGASYNILPSAMFLIYYAFINKRLFYWIASFFGIVLEFRFGTRGPMLSLALFLAVLICYSILKKKQFYKKVIGIFCVFVVVYILYFSEFLLDAAIYLSESFSERGYSTRIFDSFIKGTITDDSGRGDIYLKIINAIKTSPFLGYGLFGDRVILGGSYSHNILLEIYCDFGVILGSMIILTILCVVLRGLVKNKRYEKKMFLLMMSIMVFVKLSLSWSYLLEPWFFFLLGLCVSTSLERE